MPSCHDNLLHDLGLRTISPELPGEPMDLQCPLVMTTHWDFLNCCLQSPWTYSTLLSWQLTETTWMLLHDRGLRTISPELPGELMDLQCPLVMTTYWDYLNCYCMTVDWEPFPLSCQESPRTYSALLSQLTETTWTAAAWPGTEDHFPWAARRAHGPTVPSCHQLLHQAL